MVEGHLCVKNAAIRDAEVAFGHDKIHLRRDKYHLYIFMRKPLLELVCVPSGKFLYMENTTFHYIAALAVLLLSGCTRPASEGDHLGELHFTYSGSAEAMPHFEKGLKLLHNFEYDDAKDAFVEAQNLDSTFVMAYWGEAMTYNHPLWRQQDAESAAEALGKLAPAQEGRLTLAQTDLERDFLQSVEILYFGEGEKNDRDAAYSQYLGKMYDTHAGNEEVAAFYALSILGAVPVGRDVAQYEKSAAIAQGILAENPNHPGALHYLIHSYDDPYHAKLALNAARSYSKVAADATHALHMPSHIFLAEGMWDEVVSCNIASYDASVRRMQEKGLGNAARSYHAFSWLMYGYLQQGNFDEASRMMQEMYKYTAETPSESARSYFTAMKGTYLTHTGDWHGDIAGYVILVDDLGIVARAKNAFTEGMKACLNHDAESLPAIISNMENERKAAANLVSDTGIPMCGTPSAGAGPNQLDIDWAHVMEMELRAQQALLDGDDAVAEDWFRPATQLEGSISYDYGPPSILKPSHEMYGEWLLEQARPEEALTQFNTTLERAPRRMMALKGKLAAAKNLGDEQLAAEVEEVLRGILKGKVI
jgi:pentatricopeptide repeat protein